MLALMNKLLQKLSKASANLRNHRALIEVFKTMIDLSPNYMKEMFKRSVK